MCVLKEEKASVQQFLTEDVSYYQMIVAMLKRTMPKVHMVPKGHTDEVLIPHSSSLTDTPPKITKAY